MLDNGFIIDLCPLDSVRAQCLSDTDAEVRFRQKRRVRLMPGCRTDFWTVLLEGNLIGMIEVCGCAFFPLPGLYYSPQIAMCMARRSRSRGRGEC